MHLTIQILTCCTLAGLLVTLQSSAGALVVSAVVGNGLLLILLGLLHVGGWRWLGNDGRG